jgi:hypothetical protein
MTKKKRGRRESGGIALDEWPVRDQGGTLAERFEAAEFFLRQIRPFDNQIEIEFRFMLNAAMAPACSAHSLMLAKAKDQVNEWIARQSEIDREVFAVVRAARNSETHGGGARLAGQPFTRDTTPGEYTFAFSFINEDGRRHTMAAVGACKRYVALLRLAAHELAFGLRRPP